MSDDLEFEARRAAHRRGHSIPMRDRARIDRSFDAVQTDEPSSNPFDIRKHVPDNAQLTVDNWRQAFEAAKAAAFELVAHSFPGPDNGPAPVVYVPEGTWPIEGAPLNLTMGTLTNAMQVGLAGAGRYSTIFVDKLPGGVSHDGAIRVGYTSDPVYLYFGAALKDFTLVSDNQSLDGVGVHVRDVVEFTMSRVTIRGYSASTDIDKRGINLIVDTSFPTVSPNQHVVIDDVVCAYGFTGAKFDVVANLNIKQLNANGNIVTGVSYDQVSMIWIGGNSQYGGSGETQVGCPIYGVPGYAIRGGANKVVASGSTGTIGASSGSTATLTLPGIGQDITNIGCMVRLKGAAAAQNNTLVEIVDIPANNQVTVVASHLVAESNVTWELRTQRGLDSVDISSVYFESGGGLTGGWFRARMNKGGNQPYVTLRSNIVQNTKYLADLRDCSSADIRSNLDGTTAGVRFRNCLIVNTDFALSRVDADARTQTRLVAREFDNSPYVGNQIVGGRLVAACKQLGAVDIWDARVTTSMALVSTAVHSWTGLLNSTVLTPENAGVYPTLLSADTAMGSDCVKFTGNLNANLVDNLKGFISSSVLPGVPHNMNLLVIARCLAVDDQPGIGGGNRRIGLIDLSGSMQQEIVAGDGGFIPLNQWGEVDYGPLTGNAVSGPSGVTGVPLTNDQPRCVIAGPSSSTNVNTNNSMFVEASLQSDGVECVPNHADSNTLWPAGNNVSLHIGSYNPTQRGTLIVAFIAAFPRALGMRTRHALLDIAKTEFSKLIRY